MQEIKKNLINVFYHLGYIEIGIFLAIFVLFLLIFILTLFSYQKKILFTFLFILSFFVLFSTPFVIQIAMDKGFYKTLISYNKASPLQYANAFLIDMDVKNIGKKDISKCLVSVNVYHPSKNTLEKLKNLIQPKAIFKHMIFTALKTNQTKNFVVMIDRYYYRNYPYKISVNCH
ncbi:DUF2393 family protein [Helicobacter cappadocius]|uniref:DUF2393 family protein n=1 Tax=Helicobacter cappadocius TaxID=3063998 RepID=A0AA90PL74_9HELI|nr:MULTISPECIES: DUF2393 family protein [unclassified Helicobacter]MDO7253245.1 DUF2393 family protein [Helicobacter sp. faydin-H75]MDP2539169.1 DUF2393 family protein [Helicobacter sp. faydin-H76]